MCKTWCNSCLNALVHPLHGHTLLLGTGHCAHVKQPNVRADVHMRIADPTALFLRCDVGQDLRDLHKTLFAMLVATSHAVGTCTHVYLVHFQFLRQSSFTATSTMWNATWCCSTSLPLTMDCKNHGDLHQVPPKSAISTSSDLPPVEVARKLRTHHTRAAAVVFDASRAWYQLSTRLAPAVTAPRKS